MKMTVLFKNGRKSKNVRSYNSNQRSANKDARLIRTLDITKITYILKLRVDPINVSISPQVITIFSASNYYETGSNKGAYLKLISPDLSPHFIQFTTATNRTRNMTFRQKVGLIESSALRDLNQKIVSVKPQLLQAFQKLDANKTGKIT